MLQFRLAMVDLPQLSLIQAGFLVLILSLLTVAFVSSAGLIIVEQPVDPSLIGGESGKFQWVSYHVDTSLRASEHFVTGCDTGSELRLYEDGKRLGPPQSSAEVISTVGAGSYAYQCSAPPWTRTLIFSTSDNSDPRTNGRHYLARIPVRLAYPLLIDALSLAMISLLIVGALGLLRNL